MKKFIAFILAGIMGLSVVSCGGGRADDKYVGEWISVAGTALGMTLTGDDISGFAFDLKAGGKGTMTVEGEKAKLKWTNDDAAITIKVQGEELVATIKEDTFVLENIFDTGMDVTFAKKGSEAANPENFLAENEKNMIGTWASNKVTNVLGDDVSGAVAPDALKMTFKGDHTVDIEFRGEKLETQTWSMLDSWGSLSDSEYDFTWDLEGEELKVTYNGEEYWIFTCSK